MQNIRLSTQQHLVIEVKLKCLQSWPQLQMEMGLHGLVLKGYKWLHHRVYFITRMITQQMQHCCYKANDDAAYSAVGSLPKTNPPHICYRKCKKMHFWVVMGREVGRRQTHTRLGLSNNIMPLYTWNNSTLLNRRRLFKTICIDAS